jgi:hypothetical protein
MDIGEVLIIAIIGGVFLYEVWAVVQSILASSWSTTKGKVISSKLDIDYHTHATVQIEYSYIVNDIEYKSSNSVFGYVGYSFWIFKRWYIDEDDLVVYYNPSNPNKAVLVTGLRLFFIVEFIPFGMILYFYLNPV